MAAKASHTVRGEAPFSVGTVIIVNVNMK